MTDPTALLTPGVIVRHPDRPDWGEGQVQSSIGGRVTVNFREAGKVVVDTRVVTLILVSF
jgi:hypothetical protein